MGGSGGAPTAAYTDSAAEAVAQPRLLYATSWQRGQLTCGRRRALANEAALPHCLLGARHQ